MATSPAASGRFRPAFLVCLSGVLALLLWAAWPAWETATDARTAMTPRRALSAAYLDGRVYAVGGWNGQATQLALVETLDPTSGRWVAAPPLRVARSQHATIVADGALWTVGGWSSEQGLVSALERYSPAASACRAATPSGCPPHDPTWQIVTHLPTPRREPGAALLGRWLVVVGGFAGASDADLDGYSDRVEAYDLDQGDWRRLAALPTPRRGLALLNVDGKLLAIGGFAAPGGYQKAVEEYDPRQDRWRSLPWAITPRTWAGATVVAGSVIILGGYNLDGFLALIEQIDRRTGQLCHSPPLHTPRAWFALATTPQALWVLGGETANGFSGNIERLTAHQFPPTCPNP